MTSILKIKSSSRFLKVLTTAIVRILFSQIFSIFKEYVAWWVVYPKSILLINSCNYIWSLCLINEYIFKTKFACSLIRFTINSKKCDAIFWYHKLRNAPFSPKFFQQFYIWCELQFTNAGQILSNLYEFQMTPCNE